MQAETKRCPRCSEHKTLDEFYKRRVRAGIDRWRPSGNCKVCTKAYTKAYVGEYPERVHGWHLQRSYGLTYEDYERMLSEQGGGCAICGSDEPGQGRKWFAVDHDHACCPTTTRSRSCGRCIRGLLCSACNKALGAFEDNPERLRAAALYVEATAVNGTVT